MAPPTYSPTLKPTSSCTGSTPGWVDSSGDGCEWYESVDKPGCPHYGDNYEGEMGVANDNCCYCEGTGAPTVAPPTYSPWTWAPTVPYPTHSPTVSKAPVTPLCIGSTPNWKDVDGDGCEWYESYDTPGCELYGEEHEGDMGVAADNCCYCMSTDVRVPSCKMILLITTSLSLTYHVIIFILQINHRPLRVMP